MKSIQLLVQLSAACCNTYMLGGGLNYLGSCSKGRSMLRHIVQSLFGESNDLGVFREENWDIFKHGTTLIPCIARILVFEIPNVSTTPLWVFGNVYLSTGKH